MKKRAVRKGSLALIERFLRSAGILPARRWPAVEAALWLERSTGSEPVSLASVEPAGCRRYEETAQ